MWTITELHYSGFTSPARVEMGVELIVKVRCVKGLEATQLCISNIVETKTNQQR